MAKTRKAKRTVELTAYRIIGSHYISLKGADGKFLLNVCSTEYRSALQSLGRVTPRPGEEITLIVQLKDQR